MKALAGFLVLVAVSGCRDGSGQDTAAEPTANANVLLIIADDIGIDKVGSYAADVDVGYASHATNLPSTPVLDRLATSGVRFTDAWTNPVCAPSRATVMTGMHALNHGLGKQIGKEDSPDQLEASLTTIADLAGTAGYATGLFGKWNLGEGDTPSDWKEDDHWSDHLDETVSTEIHPLAMGWQEFAGTIDGVTYNDGGGYYDWLLWTSTQAAAPTARYTNKTTHATVKTAARALRWINAQDGPWLAWVAFNAPHQPWQAPPADCASVEGEGDRATYRAMVECMDTQIGVLLDGIRSLDDTLVIFIGDNGTDPDVAEDIFDLGRGKGTLYEDGIRVPMIVADGSDFAGRESAGGAVVDPGRVISQPVLTVDLFTTIGDWVGWDTSDAIDSISLMPTLSESVDTPREWVYTESFGTTSGKAAFRVGDWKLMVWAGDSDGRVCRHRYGLFDLAADRMETNDLVHTETDKLAELKAGLDAVISTEPGSWLDVPDC